MSVLDFKAAQKWAKLPRNIQELIENNVFCSACRVTTIIKYSTMRMSRSDLINISIISIICGYFSISLTR